jgi:ABC-2 type transport system permease protein
MLIEQTRAEFLRYLRSPFLSIFTIALPVVLYLFVGLGPAGAATIAGIPGHVYLLAGLASYSVANVMLSTFGISLTVDRSRGMDILMRATPLRPAIYLLARAIVALAFGVAALAVIGLFATIVGAVRLDALTWVALAGAVLLGSLPFLALGMAIGYQVSPNAGGVAVNLIGLPLFFAAGVFRPLSQLPLLIQHAAPFLPTYRYAQLAWSAAGASGMAPVRQNLVWLAIYAAVFAFVAVRGYRRQEARRFA